MKNKFRKPQKFFKAQEKIYNTSLLNLKDNYFDYDKIKDKMLLAKENVSNQINLVRKMINSFFELNKNKSALKVNIFFYSCAFALNISIIFLICNVFLKLPINIGIYTICYLILNIATILKQQPYLKYYLKAKFHGLSQEDLMAYENKLEKLFLEKYTIGEIKNKNFENAFEILEDKNNAIQNENKIFGNDLITIRNTAIWQIEAFKENSAYLKKALSFENYYLLSKSIVTIRKLLYNFSLAEKEEKIKLSLLIDETLDEIYNLYEKCEQSDNYSRRKVKRL